MTVFPPWLKSSWPIGKGFEVTKQTLEMLNLHTVCQSAICPNRGECWRQQTATFLILGNVCTRCCGFCSVQKKQIGEPVDPDEPYRIAKAIHKLNIRHAIITSVTRDDLDDGGAKQFAKTVQVIRKYCPGVTIELLTPDFLGKCDSLDIIVQTSPEVFGHNIETIERLYPKLRGSKNNYRRSLDVLQYVADKDPSIIIKSGFMVGHGETYEEVVKLLADLKETGCHVVVIGQYLQPSKFQKPVTEFISPEIFEQYKQIAYRLGFKYVVAGPLVRSSYNARDVVYHIKKLNFLNVNQ